MWSAPQETMVRVKESLTIDAEISKNIRNIAEEKDISVSELVNRVLEVYLQKEKNIWSEYAEIEIKEVEIRKEKEEFNKRFLQVLEEGNKEEREKAKQILKEQEERYNKIKERMIFCYQRLKELDKLEEILKYDDTESLIEICREIYHLNMTERRPLTDAVGLSDIKTLKDFMQKLDFEMLIINKEEKILKGENN